MWLIDNVTATPPKQLAQDMDLYFRGLMTSVAKSPSTFPTKVTVQRIQASHSGLDQPYCSMEIRTWDAFFTQKPLLLQVRCFQAPSLTAAQNYQKVLYFEVSPRLDQKDVQGVLAPLRASWPTD